MSRTQLHELVDIDADLAINLNTIGMKMLKLKEGHNQMSKQLNVLLFKHKDVKASTTLTFPWLFQ